MVSTPVVPRRSPLHCRCIKLARPKSGRQGGKGQPDIFPLTIPTLGPVTVRVNSAGQIGFDHLDHLGTAIASTSMSGAFLWREAYLPFGEKRLDPVGNRDKPAYTGHVVDSLTGLTYMQARYYDPVLGRFLSTDPVGYQDQMNLYAYVGNDPVNKWDPDGLEGRRVVSEFMQGVQDWSDSTGYWLGNRFGVPLTKDFYDPDLYADWQLSTQLSDSIVKFGVDNWQTLAPKALERMKDNPAYTAGRTTAGIAVGRYTGRALGPAGSGVVGLTASTQGQIDKFSASLVSGDFSGVTMGAEAETIVDGFFQSQGWDTSFSQNEDGTTTMTISRDETGSNIRQKYEVGTFTREQESK